MFYRERAVVTCAAWIPASTSILEGPDQMLLRLSLN